MNNDRQLIMADAHVHIHDCFDIENFFASAWANFSAAFHRLGFGKSFQGILFLTESNGINWFSHFCKTAKGECEPHNIPEILKFQLTKQENSLKVGFGDNKELVLIAGRQVVSKENLEVLALGIVDHFGEGNSLAEIVRETRSRGGIPVIPWGVGKWLGKRGFVVSQFMSQHDSGSLFLGDNSGRPVFWRTPSHFKQASLNNIPVLPGSDPLPFPSEYKKVGSFGFLVRDEIDSEFPARDMRKLLLNPETLIQRYGNLENAVRFIKNQFLMQLNKFN